MKKRALRKNFFMEIRTSLGRFLSIFFIVAIGVAFFSGIRSADPDMLYSGDEYFDQKKLMDIQVVSTLGLTADDIQALRNVKGIEQVEPGYSLDVLCKSKNSNVAVHVMSVLPTMNKLTVEEGKMPVKSDECAVDADFLKSAGYKIGDTIKFQSGTDEKLDDKLKYTTYKIVGSVSSPCYIAFHRGSTTIGTGNLEGFVAVPSYSFNMDVYTDLYATVDGAYDVNAFSDTYDKLVTDAEDQVEKIKSVREKARYDELVNEAQDKVDEAKEKLATAKSDADKKLGDAKKKIDDGKKELEKAKKQIEDASNQLETTKSTLSDQQAQLDRNIADTNAKINALNEQVAQLNALKDQYAALAATGATDDATIQKLQAMENQIVSGEAQIEQAKAQLSGAQAQFESAQQQINAGWQQVQQGDADLQKAKKEYTKNEKELATSQEKYETEKEKADKKIADAEADITDAEKKISEIEPAKWYIRDRNDLAEYSGYGENADRMRAIGRVFPVLFFLVAALISLTTMTRMVEEQRTQIGTLKALGYERHSIAAKYIGYASVATVLGCVVGVLVGEKIFPYVIITAYQIMYKYIPNVVIPYNWEYGLMASVTALVCTVLATFLSCSKELREPAAQLMRPPVPKQGKRVLLERISFVWKRLSFTQKATVRNLVRYKKRFFMTVFGVGGCMALLLVGYGLKDSIFEIGHIQYHELQPFDASMILNSDADEEEQDEAYKELKNNASVEKTIETYLKQVDVVGTEAAKELNLCVPQSTNRIKNFVVFRNRITKETYSLNNEGVILTEKIAKQLGVKVGDKVAIKDDKKGKIEVTVSAICENYMGHYMYMSPALYKKLYQKSPEYNCVYFSVKDHNLDKAKIVGEKVLRQKGALSVTYMADIEAQLNDMLKALNIVMFVLIISAGMLAFVVLYNLNNINITERKRELATLKVLGFYPREVAAYIYKENIILTVIGAIVGMGLGKLLHQFVIVTVEIDSAMFGRIIDPTSYLYGFIITMGFSALVNFVMYFKLKRIDMVDSLKSVE